MKRRKHRGCEEINLTPLLDVLFSILFIVMLAGVKIQNNNQDEIERLNKKVSAYNYFMDEVVIVNIENILDEGNYVLCIRTDGYKDEEIILGQKITSLTEKRINKYFENLLEDKSRQPIYIIYNCNRKNIHTDENTLVKNTLEKLEENNQEIFYKYLEVKENVEE